MNSKNKYEVCPNCFGENIVPRSWEGSDEWICNDCKNTFSSVMGFSKKEKSKIQKKHLDKMKKINSSKKGELNQVKINSDILIKVFAVLLVLVFVLIIIYTIILGFK